MNTPVITCSGVTKKFGKIEVLKGIDLEIPMVRSSVCWVQFVLIKMYPNCNSTSNSISLKW